MCASFCNLFSGSSGNSTLIRGKTRNILVDAGITGKGMEEALRSVGQKPEELDGILITHEHSDHIKGAGVLSRKYDIPLYANEKTWAAMADKIGNLHLKNMRTFVTGQDFYIGDLDILSFEIPHDAADPVGFVVYCGNVKMAVATDMGRFTKRVAEQLAGSDVLVLEANHDVEMLENGSYPQVLKNRILGGRGHLSNDTCAKALEHLVNHNVKRAYLGHLSKENNLPDLAYSTVVNHLQAAGVSIGRDIELGMTWRDRPGEMLHFGAE